MNIHLNRCLDTLICIAICAIGLTLGGATAILGGLGTAHGVPNASPAFARCGEAPGRIDFPENPDRPVAQRRRSELSASPPWVISATAEAEPRAAPWGFPKDRDRRRVRPCQENPVRGAVDSLANSRGRSTQHILLGVGLTVGRGGDLGPGGQAERPRRRDDYENLLRLRRAGI